MRLWRKIAGFVGCKYLVVRRDGSVPRWPNMVLGASDPAAPAGLRAYAMKARELGMDPEYCQDIDNLACEFEDYRTVFGAGKPDDGPERHDNQTIVEIMRGHPGVVAIYPERP